MYRVLVDYGYAEGLKYLTGSDGKTPSQFVSIDDAVKAAIREAGGLPFQIVQPIEWYATENTMV